MKTLLLILSVVLLLNGCGTSGGGSGDNAGTPAAAAPVPSETKPSIATSYYVNTDKDLVNCDKSTLGYLAYVKSSEEFKACLENGWTVVNIKGKDGSSGSNGKDGSMVSSNQWYDAITQKMWIMTNMNTTLSGWNVSSTTCGGDYRLGTGSEIAAALAHGMKVVAQALINAPTFIIASDGQAYTIATGTLGSPASAAQFCIAK